MLHRNKVFFTICTSNFRYYDCHVFYEKLVDKKNDKMKFDIIPKTNEEYISVTYGCLRIFDIYRFSSSSLEEVVKTMHVDDFEILKKRFYKNGNISLKSTLSI